MSLVDQKKMVRQMDARIARTTVERQRTILRTVREHLDAESDMDLDRLVATVAPHANYFHWIGGEDRGMKGGREAIRQLYIGALKAGLTVMEFDIERIVVDDDTVVTEGWQYQVAGAGYARACGIEADDADIFLHRFRQAILWHFDGGAELLAAENFYYSGGPTGFRKLTADEVPAAYHAQFELARSPAFAGAGIGMEQLGSMLAGSRT